MAEGIKDGLADGLLEGITEEHLKVWMRELEMGH